MKVLIACIALLMMGCYDGAKVEKSDDIANGNAYHFTESGMHYILFDKSSSRSGIFVINITKDSLEVEKLRRETTVSGAWWGAEYDIDSTDIQLKYSPTERMRLTTDGKIVPMPNKPLTITQE